MWNEKYGNGRYPSDMEPSPLTLHRCVNEHTFFFGHRECPLCRAPLETIAAPPEGIIVSHTTVRVSPTGTPFKLGLVRVQSGAKTLCIIEDDIEEEPGAPVVIIKRKGLYYAMAK